MHRSVGQVQFSYFTAEGGGAQDVGVGVGLTSIRRFQSVSCHSRREDFAYCMMKKSETE